MEQERERERDKKSERASEREERNARGRTAKALSQLRHREITRWRRWDSRRSLEEALTNDGGNFYYFRCRPIREPSGYGLTSLAASTGCVLHTFCSSSPRAPRRAPPLTNGLGVLLDELFKVLPRRGRVVTLNKDKPRARHRARRAFFIASLSLFLYFLRVFGFHLAELSTSRYHPHEETHIVFALVAMRIDFDFLIFIDGFGKFYEIELSASFFFFSFSRRTPQSFLTRESNFYSQRVSKRSAQVHEPPE